MHLLIFNCKEMRLTFKFKNFLNQFYLHQILFDRCYFIFPLSRSHKTSMINRLMLDNTSRMQFAIFGLKVSNNCGVVWVYDFEEYLNQRALIISDRQIQYWAIQIKKEQIHYIQKLFITLMFFKVVYNKQVHVYHPKGETSFESLHKYIREAFKQLPPKYRLIYLDEEDEITLGCQSDFETMQHISQKTAKIYIQKVDESFYDETQKVVLDDEMKVQPLNEEMQEMRLQSQQDSNSVRSSQPLIEVESNKPEIEIGDENETKSIQKSEKPLQKNDQPEIMEEEKSSIYEKDLLSLQPSLLDESQISSITEADIEEKFKEMLPEFMKKVKNSLLQNFSDSKKEKVIHHRVTCDQCGQRNIEGVRYKCAVCANFDLCQTCESISNHDHPFLKIKNPKQAPFKILCVVQDDNQNSFEVNGRKVQIPQMPFLAPFFEAFSKQYQKGQGLFKFGVNSSGCPFNIKVDRQQERKEEEKMEERSQPQKKTKLQEEKPVQKVEPKIEQKIVPQVEPKVEPKVEKKPEKRIFQKPAVRRQAEIMQAQRQTNERVIENSKYLIAILQDSVLEQDCHNFAKKYPTLSKEDLLSLYFSEMY